MTSLDNHYISPVLESIRAKYGELLTVEEVAEVFKYKTTAAVRKAHSRDTLPVQLYRFEGKSGLYAKAVEVADSIQRLHSPKDVEDRRKNMR